MKLRDQLPAFPHGVKWINASGISQNIREDQPIIVHFWSISCSSCKGTMYTINKWKGLYKDSFKIVSVHMPRSQADVNDALIQANISQWNMTQPVCLDHDLQVTKLFHNRIVPSFYLFDKKGLLRHIQSGENGMHMLEKRLAMLIRE